VELGTKSTVSLLKKGADVDTIEEILRIVMTGYKSKQDSCYENEPLVRVERPLSEHEEILTDNSLSSEMRNIEPTSPRLDPLLDWITRLAALDKFDLMLRFANKDIIDRAKSFLLSQSGASLTVKQKFGL
jgi:hypothetical protein